MNDIDWNKVFESRLAACCERAAADFHLSVTTPFILHEGTAHEVRFVAHFPNVGAKNGIVVCLSTEWERLHESAHAHGYTCVGVVPESCSSYNPTRWEEFIREWKATAEPAQ